MERDFYTDEFEDLVKQKADQLRIYPSDKVWKGIKRSLHPHKRRYWFGFALLLTGLTYYGIDQLIFYPSAKQTAQSVNKSSVTQKQQAKIIPFDQVNPGSLNRTQHNVSPVHQNPSLVLQEKVVIKGNSAKVFKSSTNQVALTTFVARSKNNLQPVTYFTKEEITTNPVQLVIGTKNIIPGFNIPSIKETQEDIEKTENIQKINWLEEYAVYDLAIMRPKRIHWQLSFAPTMNYRRMIGSNNANIQSNSRNIPIALNIEGDLDKLVNHKPALGFELGSYLLYSLNHNFLLKAGLQFNYSRYEIQAYSAPRESATISLNSINGLRSADITNYTQIRNFGGYAVQDLQNQYFQLSVPLGIEVNLLGSNKLQLGISGTVQPTYLLNPNTYLISSDYKNYTKEPSLVRRWNINTSAETFVSYKTAGLKWQVGPQIRYQLFSSYTNEYPIKEYLIEYGVKIGVTKTIR